MPVLELRITDHVPCRLEHEGRAVLPEELETLARSWLGRPRRAFLWMFGDTPYRCIGGAIYVLQREGFEYSWGTVPTAR